MELRYQREATVGFLLIVAAVLFVYGMIWLSGHQVRSGTILEVAFTDVSGLKVGDPVRTSGVDVGQVERIRLVAPGRVLVFLKLQEPQQPRRDASAVVRALDYFGAHFVDYDPGTPSEPLLTADSIVGQKEVALTQLVENLTTPGREALVGASRVLSAQNAAALRALLIDARSAVNKLGDAAHAPSQEAAQAMASLRDLLNQLGQVVGGEAATQTVDNMRDATHNLAQVTATLEKTTVSLDSILAKINAGRGSVGRMVNDTTLVTDLHGTMAALTDLLTDLKAHPGRYVHVSVF
jgi:phospholipid/cholesterol/gamma-HCH transport system substrate-binding protein